MEIKAVNTDKTTVETGDNIRIKFEVLYDVDYPYGYPYGYPISITRK